MNKKIAVLAEDHEEIIESRGECQMPLLPSVRKSHMRFKDRMPT